MKTETTFLAVTATMRLQIATTIENLLALLDEIDGDENLEPDLDAEPGTWTENMNSRGHQPDDENLEDGADGEPSLGAPEQNQHRSQASWAAGSSDEREDDGDDKEPSLGFSGAYSYVTRRWEEDLEAVNEDGVEDSLDAGATSHGIADHDALHAI